MQIRCGSEIETAKKLTTQKSGIWIIQGRIHWSEILVLFRLPAHPSLTGGEYMEWSDDHSEYCCPPIMWQSHFVRVNVLKLRFKTNTHF